MSAYEDLVVGAFYWVIPANDPDTDADWETREQPARYVGNGKWNCLGIDGASDWPQKWIGPRIELPEPTK